MRAAGKLGIAQSTLSHTIGARFASLSPLDLSIEDYSTNEKIAYLPRKLTEEGSSPFRRIVRERGLEALIRKVPREFMLGAQAPYARVPLADGTLVATADMPDDDLIPHLLATSDVLGTGWYAADASNVRDGSTVVVVGDDAVGLMGVLAAKEMGAVRIIAMRAGERPRRMGCGAALRSTKALDRSSPTLRTYGFTMTALSKSSASSAPSRSIRTLSMPKWKAGWATVSAQRSKAPLP